MNEVRTFSIPPSVSGGKVDVARGRAMVETWTMDGIFQIGLDTSGVVTTERALAQSRQFFRHPLENKETHIHTHSYSGYVRSGEEQTAGEADASEIFTICPDIPLHDPRVQLGMPCHGPVPWPNDEYRDAMRAYMAMVGSVGHRLLRLAALGLGLPEVDALSRLTRNGWHHMRVLRFPTQGDRPRKGIGAHTDYGMLVIAAQDSVGGLYIRPPVPGEQRPRNWLADESSAGRYEDIPPWTFVRPVADVLTAFPGDILQFLTGGHLLSTPHKVKLKSQERFALAYFHEPRFDAQLTPLWNAGSAGPVHYGTHFTNMFMRCYPERVTTRRIENLGLLRHLARTARVSDAPPSRALAG